MSADGPGIGKNIPDLGEAFLERIETSLVRAEGDRRRHDALQRVRPFLPLALLVGPVIAWRLMVVSPASTHVVVDTLAWLTFVLDVGVHVDTTVLAYLNLQALPSIVGGLLLLLVTYGLLTVPEDKD